MSILNGPRLNFWGGIRTDVSLPNNSPTIPQGNRKLHLFDLPNSQVAAEAAGYSDDQLNEWINAPTGDYYTAGGWNHYGQHVVDMQNVLVSSQGTPGAISTTGDLVGQPVYLLGSRDPVTGQAPVSGPMMVDLDPSSGITTQIYIGGLQIGGTSNPQLVIQADVVASSFDVAPRLLNGEDDAPGSSPLSGTFQVTFPLSAIVSWNQSSAMLKAIIQAPGATGIVVRFVMFEMCPGMTTPQLDADYAAGQYTPNPSIGRVIGTLAPAFAGEPLICPVGRQLVNGGTGGAGYAQQYSQSGQAMLSLDMVNLIPKADFRAVRTDITSPIGPNIDYGPVSISAGSTLLATLPDTSPYLVDYSLYGGIVDLPLTSTQSAAAQATPLSITAPNTVDDTTLAVAEVAYRLYSDQRNLYMDEYPGGVTLDLQVRYLGGPVPANGSIALKTSFPGAIVDPNNWNLLQYSATVPISQGQTSVSIPLSRKEGTDAKAGYTKLAFSLGDGKGFSNFRFYSHTDFGIPAGSIPTWDQVYPAVLRFHYLAFPAMSRFIPLNQQDAIWNARAAIVARTADAYRGTTLYMPVVRSMSPSQRALLKAYLTSTPWQP
ncbi:hypothetical protein TUM18999_31220 [Pseudomonas tohonis]|uniref:Uncharacterized protein n=1 Tax=Pseudomonas tohonis TaxID=2725477 RepID=A0A6J4E8V2_9PSED|nr:hypothetical protein [Pseudomonas tohonis]BCG24931.1 hypothetical protein TUM18999_31220 [Pseudomonas tohonis]GJN53828.1 hypothetical protein TUM20286_35800 [Pseudomonas tohonis]